MRNQAPLTGDQFNFAITEAQEWPLSTRENLCMPLALVVTANVPDLFDFGLAWGDVAISHNRNAISVRLNSFADIDTMRALLPGWWNR